jgi:3-hydroxyacyl-CoA dehydrogenase
MVNANILGIKTGEGFYKYTLRNKEMVVSERFK